VKDRGVWVGSLLGAFLASACCLGPLVLGAIGVGSLGAAAVLAPFRPWFLLMTAVFLGVGFFLAYRPIRAACGPDGTCTEPASRRIQRIILWTVTVLTVALATYPSWGARSAPQRAPIAMAAADRVVVLDVDGMTCVDCEAEIQHELEREPGVRQAQVSFEARRATIALARHIPSEKLTAAVARAGYRARIAAR
jgi:mercuric ion transport protein